MITIRVQDYQIEMAKSMRDEFDLQKTYNKFVCNHNWIGVLGEIVLNDWLVFNHKQFEWIDFIKNQWTDPDFIISGKSIDLKTSYGNTLNITRPKFDIYISARLSKCNNFLVVHSYLTKKELEVLILNGRAEPMNGYYKIKQCDMNHVEELEVFK